MSLRSLRPRVRPSISGGYAHRPTAAARLAVIGRSRGARYTLVSRGRRADWSKLRYFDGSPIRFTQPLRNEFPDLGYAEIRNARVYGRQGYVQTREGVFCIDSQIIHKSRRFRYYESPMRVRPVQRIEGKVLNLATTFGWRGNYGHGVMDGLGRVGLMIARGYDLGSFDHVLTPQYSPKSFTRLLNGVGLRSAVHTAVDELTNFECELLVQPSFPGVFRHYSEHPSIFMRASGIKPVGSGRRLLMLRTGEERAVHNRGELLEVADEFDLEVYEPRKSRFPPADFAAATLVVGAHGSNLADVGACAPGSALVELMPSAQTMPYFATLAVSGGLEFRGVPGTSVDNDWRADFVVAPDDLRAALRSLDRT